VDGGRVVFVGSGGGRLRKTEFGKNGAKVFGVFGGGNSGIEFGLGGAGGGNRLCLGLVGDNTTREHEGVAGSGAAIAKVIGMSGIDVTGKGEGG